MTLREVEDSIQEFYQFFTQVAPGVTPEESGRLGELWAMFDEMVN